MDFHNYLFIKYLFYWHLPCSLVGMGMDRKKKQKFWNRKRITTIALISTLCILLTFGFLSASENKSMNIDRDRITVTTILEDDFLEYIPRSGTVLPAQTEYIDAVQAGKVKRILAESGDLVRRGDTLMVLANSDLELSVMSRESNLYHQLSNVRTTRLELDKNNLNQMSQLAEIDYQLKLIEPQYRRFERLLKEEMISKREFEEIKERYEYNLKRKNLFKARYQRDSLAWTLQRYQLNFSEGRMLQSLKAVTRILDDLTIKAPRDGQVSLLDFNVGQSIRTNERIGQIDELNDYKLRVDIDEFYLPRIVRGLQATCEWKDQIFNLEIAKVYPTVNEGLFQVDMEFLGEDSIRIPEGIRRGLSLRVRLELGNSEKAVLISSGGFYQDTGGNWVFVLKEGQATKRQISLGRKNPEYYEVLYGLQPGEQVITSNYEYFGENEILNIMD